MDADELLRSDAPFVADTSAWWRAATLPNDLGSLLQRAVLDERLWITPIVRMEILYSARTSSEHVELERELDALLHRDAHFDRLAEGRRSGGRQHRTRRSSRYEPEATWLTEKTAPWGSDSTAELRGVRRDHVGVVDAQVDRSVRCDGLTIRRCVLD